VGRGDGEESRTRGMELAKAWTGKGKLDESGGVGSGRGALAGEESRMKGV
jgi:hypothetical protein